MFFKEKNFKKKKKIYIFFFSRGGGREFIRFVVYKVVKRGRQYHGCGEEYNVEKRERGSNIIFPMILRLLGRISRREAGKGPGWTFFGEKSRFKKKSGWGRISSCHELKTLT